MGFDRLHGSSVLMLFALLLGASLFPIHGTVLSALPNGVAAVRNHPVPGMLAGTIRLYRLDPKIRVEPGVGIEGFVDRSTDPWTLRRALVAAPFAPGMPDAARVIPVDIGSRLPEAQLVDQNGAPVNLGTAFTNKTVLLSFIFTRCTDICPLISAKYAYMQQRLSPDKFALVEITLDPTYDSPAILKRYAERFGAEDGHWYLLTGTGTTIARILDQFGINSLRDSPTDYIHNDRLFVVDPEGRLAYVVDTASWDPRGAIAEAQSVSGMASNPFERFKLSLIASVVAFCGGSQYAGIVLLELALFAVIVVFVTAGLWTVGRTLWKS
jgi:protein SCO1/2